MSQQKEKPKHNQQKFNWKKKSVHNTFESADKKRSKLVDSGEKHVKIKRCGPGGTQFKVSVGIPLEKKDTKSKKKSNKKKEKADDTK